MDVDAQTLKTFFSTPLAMFLLMIAGALGSAFKQMAMARRNGVGITATSYLRDYWPETLIAVGGVVVAFLTMLMTDTLNFASAVLGGFAANSAADVFTKDGRSTALTKGDGS